MNINGARWRRPGSDGRREGVGRSPLTGGAPTIAHATAHARARRSAPPGVLNGNGHRVDRNDAHLNARGSDVEGPLGSIVIPARNEATVVGRTLADVFTGVDPRLLEVVVACNGCTDTTVQVANEVGAPVTVLDLPAVGKAGAIRAAELTTSTLPRLYLDADVRLEGRSAVAVLAALREGAVAARPPVRYETTGAARLVKRYYRQRMRLPSVRTDLCGAGVYGLSAAARSRFDVFPDMVADDLFAARVVEPSEVIIVPCPPVVISVPRDVRSLVRTLARAHNGNRELFERMPDLARPTTGSVVSQLLRSIAIRWLKW